MCRFINLSTSNRLIEDGTFTDSSTSKWLNEDGMCDGSSTSKRLIEDGTCVNSSTNHRIVIPSFYFTYYVETSQIPLPNFRVLFLISQV